ncbi:MAG: hypothetical protein FWC65_05200 [Treponema sp.]|nr:hypothetical protein [Treponema sp.]
MKRFLFVLFLFLLTSPIYAQTLPSWVRMGMSEEEIRRNFNGELTLEIGQSGRISGFKFLSGNDCNQRYEFWIHPQVGLIQVMLFEEFTIANFNSIISSLSLRFGNPEFEGGEYYFILRLPPDIEEIVVAVHDGFIEIIYV